MLGRPTPRGITRWLPLHRQRRTVSNAAASDRSVAGRQAERLGFQGGAAPLAGSRGGALSGVPGRSIGAGRGARPLGRGTRGRHADRAGVGQRLTAPAGARARRAKEYCDG
jgi:hypothetical protein